MRTTTALVAALAAASSVAGQEETERKRIYFPRHIKRQFTNTTITAVDVPIANPAPSSTVPSTPSLVSEIASLVSDLVGGLVSSADPKVTTIVVSSTVFVTPSALPSSHGNGTGGDPVSSAAPSKSLPPIAGRPPPQSSAPPVSSKPVSSKPVSSATNIVSVAPTSTTSSSTAIFLFPTGASSSVASTAPTTTATTATTTKGPTDPLTSILSDIVSVVTSVASVILPPLHNVTESVIPSSLIVTTPTVSIGTGPVTGVTSTTTPLAVSETSKPPVTVTSPPILPSTVTDPPPVSNTSEPPVSKPPPVTVTNSTISQPPITVPPSSSPTLTVTIGNNTQSANVTEAPTSTLEGPLSGVTSIPHLGTVTNSQSWLPTTILVDPTSTSLGGGLAPTSLSGLPSGLPKAITPETGLAAPPNDTVLIQIGLLAGYNYPFVVSNTKAAAQIFQLLPRALSYVSGVSLDQIQMRQLVPYDTLSNMKYVTTLAIVTYPSSLVSSLQSAVDIPSSVLYNNPDQLIFNFTKEINNAISITLGSLPGDGTGSGSNPSNPTASTTASGPFGNDSTDTKTPGQQGTTAGIVGGAVFVAAAYGAVMFIIARRYKSKKQAHRRASSLSNPSEMRQTPRSSPALMGGALLSRDFTSSYGGVAGGRDSHGSGRSGMNNSSRTQYISAPVAAENSLGWN